MILGAPAALISSLIAVKHAPDKGFALAALILSSVEIISLAIIAALMLIT